MKIKNISCEIKLIALKTPFITALRRVENVEFVRVFVECENGLLGIGEAPATKAITNEDIYDIMSSIWKVEHGLIDQTLEESLAILHSNCEIGSSAKASLDMAIVSLLAQEKNQKLYEYFGAKEPVSLKTDITISFKKPHEMIEDSRLAMIEGKDILKIKLAEDIKHAINVTMAISTMFPDAKLIIDANQAWNLEDSLLFVESVKDLKIELIEQPVVASDLESLKQITQVSTIPILADESVFTLEDVKRVVESNSADMINVKLMKCGGVTKAVEILEYAREKDVKCMLGSMLEGPHSIDVALHLAMAYEDVIKYIDLDSPLLYREPLQNQEFIFSKNEIIYKGK